MAGNSNKEISTTNDALSGIDTTYKKILKFRKEINSDDTLLEKLNANLVHSYKSNWKFTAHHDSISQELELYGKLSNEEFLIIENTQEQWRQVESKNDPFLDARKKGIEDEFSILTNKFYNIDTDYDENNVMNSTRDYNGKKEEIKGRINTVKKSLDNLRLDKEKMLMKEKNNSTLTELKHDIFKNNQKMTEIIRDLTECMSNLERKLKNLNS